MVMSELISFFDQKHKVRPNQQLGPTLAGPIYYHLNIESQHPRPLPYSTFSLYPMALTHAGQARL